MPGTVRVTVLAARNLPVMDRASELTDAFVEIRFAGVFRATEVCPKTLSPTWSSKVYSFEVNDETIQDEPVQLKVMDYDTYSAHDPIGQVYIRLNNLVQRSASSSLEGWFPIYDTLHGIRGALKVKVQVELFSDQHFFRSSSCGMMFFTTSTLPSCYQLDMVHGFIEELVVNDDPEYQWIDRIRSTRASNEARQLAFMKLSGELQRKAGLKGVELGGNAILGYQQNFDLEGESGIVVRGIGTAVTVSAAVTSGGGGVATSPMSGSEGITPLRKQHGSEDNLVIHQLSSSFGSVGAHVRPYSSPIKMSRTHSVSTDSDGQPATGTGPIPTPLEPNLGDSLGPEPGIDSTPRHSVRSREFPFITLRSLPPGAITHVGGVVSARSVKLLDKINNPEDPQTRDAWWREVRCEIRSHMKVLNCTEVAGYQEYTSIYDNLCLLSASGTAMCINWSMVTPHIEEGGDSEDDSKCPLPCPPYLSSGRFPFAIQLSHCGLCKSHLVSNLLLMTTDPPSDWPVRGQGALIQTKACRVKKRVQGDQNAYILNELLPFVEYRVHCCLINKLRLLGMNVVCGLRVKISLGETVVTAIAEGTAIFLGGLPAPGEFVSSQLDVSDAERWTKQLNMVQHQNRLKYLLEHPGHLSFVDVHSEAGSPETEEAPEMASYPQGGLGPGGTTLLKVEDEKLKEDDLYELLHDTSIPQGFQLSNLAWVPGLASRPISSKFLAVIRRDTIVNKQLTEKEVLRYVNDECNKALESLVFRCRREQPCHVTSVTMDISYPDDDEVQLLVSAMATKMAPSNESSLEQFEVPFEGQQDHVVLTSFEVIPDHIITKHLGLINLFIIRETTALYEQGGTPSFLQMLLLEAASMVTQTVTVLGGNAVVNYTINNCVLQDSLHKNQSQCLLNLSGDVVLVEKPTQEEAAAGSHLDASSAVDTLVQLQTAAAPQLTQQQQQQQSLKHYTGKETQC